MKTETQDRRHDAASACAVCGTTDTRVLSFTRLFDGQRVAVCGSHKTAHQRSDTIARTIDELRALTADRRSSRSA